MADHRIAIEKVLEKEGGFQKNPNDAGNYQCSVGVAKRQSGKYVCPNGNLAHLTGTNMGISAPTYQTYMGRIVTDTEMKNLTTQKATEIYKKLFWDKINGDDIKEQLKAEILFDAYVNQTGWVKTMLSDTLNVPSTTINFPLLSDTINKINDDVSFAAKFVKEREKRYKETAARAGQSGFLRSWLNRLEEFNTEIAKIVPKTIPGKIILVIGGISIFALIVYVLTKKQN